MKKEIKIPKFCSIHANSIEENSYSIEELIETIRMIIESDRTPINISFNRAKAIREDDA